MEPGFILTNVKIFQFSHSTCRIIGQHALCGKENLIVSEYKLNLYDPDICLPGIPIRRGRENTMLVSITSGGESIWGIVYFEGVLLDTISAMIDS